MPIIAPPQLLQTERLTIKRRVRSMAGAIFTAIESDRPRLTRFLSWVNGLKNEAAEFQVLIMNEEKWDKSEAFSWGIFLKEGDIFIGCIDARVLSQQNAKAEIGYWIVGQHEGKGYVTEATRKVEEVLFAGGFHRIEIHCSTLNNRSGFIPQRLGYRHEGTLISNFRYAPGEKFHDTLIYGKVNPSES